MLQLSNVFSQKKKLTIVLYCQLSILILLPKKTNGRLKYKHKNSLVLGLMSFFFFLHHIHLVFVLFFFNGIFTGYWSG